MSIQGSINSAIGALGRAVALSKGLNAVDDKPKATPTEAAKPAAKPTAKPTAQAPKQQRVHTETYNKKQINKALDRLAEQTKAYKGQHDMIQRWRKTMMKKEETK